MSRALSGADIGVQRIAVVAERPLVPLDYGPLEVNMRMWMLAASLWLAGCGGVTEGDACAFPQDAACDGTRVLLCQCDEFEVGGTACVDEVATWVEDSFCSCSFDGSMVCT